MKKLDLGSGYIVTVPNKEQEEKLLNVLRKRKNNYIIVMKLGPLTSIDFEKTTRTGSVYFITSRNHALIKVSHINDLEGLSGLSIKEITENDLAFINLLQS